MRRLTIGSNTKGLTRPVAQHAVVARDLTRTLRCATFPHSVSHEFTVSAQARKSGKGGGPSRTHMTDYLGNSNTKEVHYLSSQRANCQIAEIRPEHRVGFKTLREAHAAGYDNCHWCLGNSRR